MLTVATSFHNKFDFSRIFLIFFYFFNELLNEILSQLKEKKLKLKSLYALDLPKVHSSTLEHDI